MRTLSFEQAFELASQFVESYSDDDSPTIILLEEIKEEDLGWIFFWDSAKYIKTGNPMHRLGGNFPFLVERETGNLFRLGWDWKDDLEVYRKGGNPYVQSTTFLRLWGCASSSEKRHLAHHKEQILVALQKQTGFSVEDASQIIRELFEGKEPTFSALSCRAAWELVDFFGKLGVRAAQIDEECS